MPKRQFGVSTRVYYDRRLCRDHMIEIASHGFEAVEVFATRTHFDYHNPAAIGDLQQWLGEAGLALHSIHAPIAESYVAGRWGSPFSLASADGAARARAVDEAVKALHVARRIPTAVLVVHAGMPRTAVDSAPSNSRDAARRSLEELQREAAPLGVSVAVEIIPNELSRAGSIVHVIEAELEGLEGGETGVCLDFGHAHMVGDLLDAIETVSGHLVTADVHDNHGRADEHLMPFDGTIDWPSSLTALQKIGYEGALIFEVSARGPIRETLARARQARQRMESMMGETDH